MSGESKSFLWALLLGGLLSAASTIPLWRDIGEGWDWLLLFSLPGGIVAFPLGAMGIAGTAHGPSIVVTASVDFMFYVWLFYWLLMRRLRRER